MTATGSWANAKPLDTAAQMAAPPYANPNEHRAPMKSPSECGWKLGDTEALRDERQLGRHVDLLTNKAFSWKLPGGSGNIASILAQVGGQVTPDFPHGSRVGCSELSAGLAVSDAELGEGFHCVRRMAWRRFKARTPISESPTKFPEETKKPEMAD